MMATPVRNTREKSSSLGLLQESIRRPKDSHKDLSLSSHTPSLLLTHPIVGEEEDSSNTGLKAAPGTVSPIALQLEYVLSSTESKFPELVFALRSITDDFKPILVVTQRDVSYHPPFGFTSRVHITIQQDGLYQVHILMQRLKAGTVSNEEDVFCLLERFSSASLCKFFPGIEWTFYQEHYFKVIRFHLKSVRYAETPFYRVDSVNCKLWFELPSNATLEDKAQAEVLCSPCKRLISDLNWQLKRTQNESPSKRLKRQDPSSRARLTYMSPGSRLKRKQCAAIERAVDKRKLARYEPTEVTLADEQHTNV